MANNRIYMRCKACGEQLYLGKCFADSYYWENYFDKSKHLEDFLNEFFEKHTYCKFMGTGAYEICYENDDFTGVEMLEDNEMCVYPKGGLFTQEEIDADFPSTVNNTKVIGYVSEAVKENESESDK